MKLFGIYWVRGTYQEVSPSLQYDPSTGWYVIRINDKETRFHFHASGRRFWNSEHLADWFGNPLEKCWRSKWFGTHYA